MKEMNFTTEQINLIAYALRTTMRVNQESIDNMCQVCGVNGTTKETAKPIKEGIIRLKTLLDYVES